MANINSLTTNSSSSTSNLYGTRNVLSGLASGMDTEAMIENSVAGYKTKVTQLQQQQTKYQWKQDAYRSITDKLYALNETYTSYTSKTNLYSNAFFNNSVTTSVSALSAAGAENVDKVSATGKSSSDIEILAAQTATAARYAVNAAALGLNIPGATGSDFNKGKVTVGALEGSMTFTYNSQKVEISFDESDTGLTDATKLKEAIEKKLSEQNITVNSETKSASDVIKVEVDANGKITFSDNLGNGATPYISSASGNLEETLQFTHASSVNDAASANSLTFPAGGLDTQKKLADYLNGKEFNVTLDGVSKSITLSGLTSNGDNLNMSSLQTSLQNAINDAFGTGKVTVDTTGGSLSFEVNNQGSTFAIAAKKSDVGEKLGMKSGLTSYLNTGSSIESLLDGKFTFSAANAATADTNQVTMTRESENSDFYKGSDGNRYKLDGSNYRRVNDNGDFLYELKINGKSVYVSKNDGLDSVMNSINSSDAGVTASYSKLTGKFVFNAKETGEANGIRFDNDLAKSLFQADNAETRTLADSGVNFNSSLLLDGADITSAAFITQGSTLEDLRTAINNNSSLTFKIEYDANTNGYSFVDKTTGEELKDFDKTLSVDGGSSSVKLKDLFSASYVAGRDSKVVANINGDRVELTRSSNNIDIDGLSVNLKDSFGDVENPQKADTVSFKTSADADSIVKTIKEFVESYNAILKEVHNAYATQPAEKSSSSHAKYEPLTDDDKASMSDKAIENYEAKAKQGILFGDNDLSALYNKMVNAFSAGSNADLKDIGISTSYSDGVTQIKLNESKLRSALESDPDKVRNAFTKSKESGASSDGLMTSIKNTVEQYASTSIGSPGILVKKAGSTFSSNSLLSNTVQKQIDTVQKQIEKWQSKMSSKIDYYTRQFTALEKLMNTMNSQSSALAGLMGG